MYGWRGRIGLIYLSSGGLDQEFLKFLPDGVSVHIARLSGPEESGRIRSTIEDHLKLIESDRIETAAKQLSSARANVIALADTSMSFLMGPGADAELIRRIESSTGTAATTTSSAALDAFRRLGIRKVSVATPYPDELNQRLTSFFEGSGVKVVCVKGLNIYSDWETDNQPPEAVYELAKEADASQADGVFIACTALRTAEVLQQLEEDLEKPVVSANQATIWKALRMMGVGAQISGYGSLMKVT